MFFYKVEGHMPKLSSFGRGIKIGLKSHLRASCMQPFNYIQKYRQKYYFQNDFYNWDWFQWRWRVSFKLDLTIMWLFIMLKLFEAHFRAMLEKYCFDSVKKIVWLRRICRIVLWCKQMLPQSWWICKQLSTLPHVVSNCKIKEKIEIIKF